MQGLTTRQQQILSFIQTRQATVGVAPSLREIAKEFGFRSMTAAADHVRALRRKGALMHHPRMARAHTPNPSFGLARRTIAAIPIQEAAPDPLRAALSAATDSMQSAEPGENPVVPEMLQVDLTLFGLEDADLNQLYAFIVRDDAMTGRDIQPGDIAIVDRAADAMPGENVAVVQNGGYGLKTLVLADDERCLQDRRTDGSDLVPAEGVPMHGVLVGLIRRYRAALR